MYLATIAVNNNHSWLDISAASTLVGIQPTALSAGTFQTVMGGTPSGVGYAMDPSQSLKHGDTVVCEI